MGAGVWRGRGALGCLGCSLPLLVCPGKNACSYECCLDVPECYPSLLIHGHFNPSTAAAAARRFQVAAVYVLSLIHI